MRRVDLLLGAIEEKERNLNEIGGQENTESKIARRFFESVRKEISKSGIYTFPR